MKRPNSFAGLKALFLLVGGLHAMPAFCIVIVHDHRIDTQFDYIGLRNPQTPDEKGLQKAAEQKDARPGECFEKAFDLMRRGHVFDWRLDAAGIAFITGNLVEVCQAPTGSIGKKAENLFEKLCNLNSFSVFSDGSEPVVEPAKNLNAVHIGHEQGQPGSSGQPSEVVSMR